MRGGHPEENAKALLELLSGKKTPYRDIVILNSAAALIIAGQAKALADGAKIASEMIDSGKAKAKLNQLISITTQFG